MGDDSFKYSLSRTSGLGTAERALVVRAYQHFGLPLRLGDSQKIAGVLLLPSGHMTYFKSGVDGGSPGGVQDGYLPRGTGTGVNLRNSTHVEAHCIACAQTCCDRYEWRQGRGGGRAHSDTAMRRVRHVGASQIPFRTAAL